MNHPTLEMSHLLVEIVSWDPPVSRPIEWGIKNSIFRLRAPSTWVVWRRRVHQFGDINPFGGDKEEEEERTAVLSIAYFSHSFSIFFQPFSCTVFLCFTPSFIHIFLAFLFSFVFPSFLNFSYFKIISVFTFLSQVFIIFHLFLFKVRPFITVIIA